MPEVGVEVVHTGDLPTPESYVFRRGLVRVVREAVLPGGRKLKLACIAYVVRHPTEGVLLIDTGFHTDAASDRRKDFGTPMSLMFRSLEPAGEPFDEQLRRLGVEPADVDRVVMTHLHVDHTSGMRLLPRARFIVAAAEWRAATRPRAAGKGYVAHHLPPESRVERVDFERDSAPHGPLSRTIDLLGDGSVRLVSTPGHTPGHLSVLLRIEGGRELLVVGDAAYTLRSIREQLLPQLTADDGLYRRTLGELHAFGAANPDAIVVPSHDPDAWRAVREPAAVGS